MTLKSKKNNRIVGLFLAMIMILSVCMPMSVFAADSKIRGVQSAGTNQQGNLNSNIKTVSLHGSQTVNGDKILTALGGQNGTAVGVYTNGNISFNSGTGILSVVTKGETFELVEVPHTGSTNTDVMYINPTAFKNANQNDVTKAMRLFVDKLGELETNPDTIQQIMSDIQDTDDSVATIMLPLIFSSTKGDLYSAYKVTSPFLNILSVILGVGAVLLIILLLFSTVMDLAYIGLPVWREAQANKEGGGNKHPFGVSYEALRTVNEVESGLGSGGNSSGDYRNAYLVYFKRRALTYIILSICIMYLICGGLSGIIGFVLSMSSGFVS